MSTAFSFFLRLFLCFVAARFLLQAIGVEGRDYLVGLTLLFLVNVYWFSHLVFRDRTAAPEAADRRPSGSPMTAAPEAEEPTVPPGAAGAARPLRPAAGQAPGRPGPPPGQEATPPK